MTPVIEILQEFLFLSVVFKLVDNIVNGALSNRSKLYDTIIETKSISLLKYSAAIESAKICDHLRLNKTLSHSMN